MTLGNLSEEFSELQFRADTGSSVILDGILSASSWESAEALCFRALPSCDVYSVRPSSCGWCVEIEYDNLLHEGKGATQLAALSDALRGILEVLKSSRAC